MELFSPYIQPLQATITKVIIWTQRVEIFNLCLLDINWNIFIKVLLVCKHYKLKITCLSPYVGWVFKWHSKQILGPYCCTYQLTSCEVLLLSVHLCPGLQPSASSMTALPYPESLIHWTKISISVLWVSVIEIYHITDKYDYKLPLQFQPMYTHTHTHSFENRCDLYWTGSGLQLIGFSKTCIEPIGFTAIEFVFTTCFATELIPYFLAVLHQLHKLVMWCLVIPFNVIPFCHMKLSSSEIQQTAKQYSAFKSKP